MRSYIVVFLPNLSAGVNSKTKGIAVQSRAFRVSANHKDDVDEIVRLLVYRGIGSWQDLQIIMPELGIRSLLEYDNLASFIASHDSAVRRGVFYVTEYSSGISADATMIVAKASPMPLCRVSFVDRDRDYVSLSEEQAKTKSSSFDLGYKRPFTTERSFRKIVGQELETESKRKQGNYLLSCLTLEWILGSGNPLAIISPATLGLLTPEDEECPLFNLASRFIRGLLYYRNGEGEGRSDFDLGSVLLRLGKRFAAGSMSSLDGILWRTLSHLIRSTVYSISQAEEKASKSPTKKLQKAKMRISVLESLATIISRYQLDRITSGYLYEDAMREARSPEELAQVESDLRATADLAIAKKQLFVSSAAILFRHMIPHTGEAISNDLVEPYWAYSLESPERIANTSMFALWLRLSNLAAIHEMVQPESNLGTALAYMLGNGYLNPTMDNDGMYSLDELPTLPTATTGVAYHTACSRYLSTCRELETFADSLKEQLEKPYLVYETEDTRDCRDEDDNGEDPDDEDEEVEEEEDEDDFD